MKIKNYDTPTACKKNYYFSEKKKAIAFLLDCLNIRKLSQSKPQLSLHNHVVVNFPKPMNRKLIFIFLLTIVQTSWAQNCDFKIRKFIEYSKWRVGTY